MFAYPPKADIDRPQHDVRFVPKADIAQSGNYWSPGERRSCSQHYFGRSAMGQTFDIAQLTTKPTRQPKMTSATLCRPCSTPVSLEWDVSPAAITMAAVIGA